MQENRFKYSKSFLSGMSTLYSTVVTSLQNHSTGDCSNDTGISYSKSKPKTTNGFTNAQHSRTTEVQTRAINKICLDVGLKRVGGGRQRVSPPPRRRAMLTLRPSLPDQMTQETGKRPNGAAAAILDVRLARTPRHDYYEGIPRLGAAAVDTSHGIYRASFSPNHHSKQRFLGVRRPKSLAQSAQSNSDYHGSCRMILAE